MERIIIHSDLNNFYASVEKKLAPELAGLPIAVCGDREMRHGIVLAKSEEAKKFGVKTGEPIWSAQKKCKNLIIVPPRFDEYVKYSRAVRAVYARYTDLIENYGIDECWLDISTSTLLFPTYKGEKFLERNGEKYYADGFLMHLGDAIRNTVKDELGLTVSCGVSFNKVFAKLGSDIKKPDATTVISKANYRQIVNGLPVEDLLFVGASTKKKLDAMGLNTIGRLAAAKDEVIIAEFGKVGVNLLKNARGEDGEPVKHMDEKREMKSIGNSCTYKEDLTDLNSIKRCIFVICESVATRLRESGQGLANTVHLWVRYGNFTEFSVQTKVRHTALCGEIAMHAYELFTKNIKSPFKVRALGVTISGFDNDASQITYDEEFGNYNKREQAERCVDRIRKKHGYDKLQRGIVAEVKEDMKNDIKNTHIIKPAKIDYPEDVDE